MITQELEEVFSQITTNFSYLRERVEQLEAAPMTGAGGGGAPSNAEYLVNSANAILTNEIVVTAVAGRIMYGNIANAWTTLNHPGAANKVFQSSAALVQWSIHDLILNGDLTVPAIGGTSALGAGTLTYNTINDATLANHTHAITNSSNPGAARFILSTDASGHLTLVELNTVSLDMSAGTATITIDNNNNDALQISSLAGVTFVDFDTLGTQTLTVNPASVAFLTVVNKELRVVNDPGGAGVSLLCASFDGRGTAAINNEGYNRYRLLTDLPGIEEFARFTWVSVDPTFGSEDGAIYWSLVEGGSLTKELHLSASALYPEADDGLALGAAGQGFSDVFLADGAFVGVPAGPGWVFDDTNNDITTNVKVGIKTPAPLGTLHVETGSSGAYTPSALSDDLVVEHSGTGGISIAVPDASTARIAFGSPSDSIGALLLWSYSGDLFSIGTAKAGSDLRLMSGNNAEAMRITSGRDVVIGDTVPDRRLHVTESDAVTVAITYAQRITHETSGMAAPGFGVGIEAELESTTTNRLAGAISWEWDVATDAIRASSGLLTSYYIGTERDAIGWHAHSDGITVDLSGGRIVEVTEIAVGDSPYTVTANDYAIFCDSSGGDITVNLPAIAGITGTVYYIENDGAGTVTVDASGAETINGAATFDLIDQESITIICMSTEWRIV